MATLAFTIAFAVWSLLSSLAPQFQQQYHMSNFDISLLIAIPVLLGSLARIPLGLVTDRFGGRKVMTLLLLFVILPLLGITTANSLPGFLFWGFLLGIAGSSFAAGVPYVSHWFSTERQGLALGIFGIGGIGTAISARFVPQITRSMGSWQPIFFIFASITFLMAITFYFLAGNDERPTGSVKTLQQQFNILKQEKLAWAFSLFYSVTFGGFVAFSLYLPTLLTNQFHLDKVEVGNRIAIFVIFATLARPFGGWLADRIGAANILISVFMIIPLLALILSFQPGMILLTCCFLLMALLFGLGGGAVFKLVPQYFPKQAGTVSGLVGAAGGLGGFFPPLIMGLSKTNFGSYTLGYVLLAIVAVICLGVAWLTLGPQRRSLQVHGNVVM
jgi:NNP family nitrate/nitrite transporter-like MFS transporter